jgi:hypothetical protein
VRLHRLVARVVVAEGQQAVLLGRELKLLLALLRGLATEVKESNGGLVTIEKSQSVMSGPDGDGDDDEASNEMYLLRLNSWAAILNRAALSHC